MMRAYVGVAVAARSVNRLFKRATGAQHKTAKKAETSAKAPQNAFPAECAQRKRHGPATVVRGCHAAQRRMAV